MLHLRPPIPQDPHIAILAPLNNGYLSIFVDTAYQTQCQNYPEYLLMFLFLAKVKDKLRQIDPHGHFCP